MPGPRLDPLNPLWVRLAGVAMPARAAPGPPLLPGALRIGVMMSLGWR